MSGSSSRYMPWTAVAVFLLLSAAYSIVVPAWEAPDESAHFQYLNCLLGSHRLPGPSDTYEAHQPPTYYALVALAMQPWHPGPFQVAPRPNPAFEWTGPQKNLFLHAARRPFDWDPETAAFHIVRLLQLAFGAVAVWFTWKLARLATPDDADVAWLAAMLAATLPQFLFISGSLSNDNIANALSAVAFYVIVRLEPRPGTRASAAAAGLLIGACLLAKMSTIFLLPLWVTACAVTSLPRRERVVRAATGVAAALAVSGWFYAWNHFRFGNLAGNPESFSWHTCYRVLLPGYWYYLFRSFWGRFGWLNVKAPVPVYAFWIVVSAVMIAGIVRLAHRAIPPSGDAPGGWWHRALAHWRAGEKRGPVLLAVGALVFLLLLLVSYSLLHDPFFQPQGRFLFAGLAPVTLLMALGCLHAFPSPRLRPLLLYGLPAAMAIVNIVILVRSIYPAYY